MSNIAQHFIEGDISKALDKSKLVKKKVNVRTKTGKVVQADKWVRAGQKESESKTTKNTIDGDMSINDFQKEFLKTGDRHHNVEQYKKFLTARFPKLDFKRGAKTEDESFRLLSEVNARFHKIEVISWHLDKLEKSGDIHISDVAPLMKHAYKSINFHPVLSAYYDLEHSDDGFHQSMHRTTKQNLKTAREYY